MMNTPVQDLLSALFDPVCLLCLLTAHSPGAVPDPCIVESCVTLGRPTGLCDHKLASE